MNTFPVPYYRKIMLEKRDKFRVRKDLKQDDSKPVLNQKIVTVNDQERVIIKIKNNI